MGNLPANPTISFIIFAFFVIIGGIIATAIYVYRCFTKNSSPLWKGTHAPTLPLSWLYIVVCLICLGANGAFVPWILPVMGIFLAALVVISHGKIPSKFWHLSFKDIPKYLKISLGFFFVIIIPLQLTASLSESILAYFKVPIEPQEAIEKLLQSKNKKELFYFFLDASLLAPVWEEIVFRGFFYPLFKAKIGKNIALVLVSILFATAHYHLPTFIPLAFFGMILGWVYENQGSLGYPIALHAIFNTFSATSVLLLR